MPRPKKNNYFTKEHEDAIVEYCKSTDKQRREHLYNLLIGPVLSEVVNKIVFTYKFTTLPNIAMLTEECKVWLVTVLDKYQPEKGFKAFSYFSVLIKNRFIFHVKKQSQQQTREVQYNDISKELEFEYLVTDNNYVERRAEKEFFDALKFEIGWWQGDEDLKDNEKKVLSAIQVLFDNVEQIEIFNKKAFYLYIRELTNLSTKQIVSALVKIRERYQEFKEDWVIENY